MLFHPSIIALLTTSILTSAMLLYSGYYAYLIIMRWDLTSGSEFQLSLERRTYLISTILTYTFAFQVLAFFLFLFTADNLHTFFVGAMCAAGALNVNKYGYPALVLKVVNLLAAGVWLIVNFVDNSAYDYPLIKKKYIFLLVISPFILAETILLANYFLGLDPNIITSCCGSLFGTDKTGVGSSLAVIPARPIASALGLALLLVFATGARFCFNGKGVLLFSLFSGVTFFVAVAALISFISLYIYELPTHHCPFCILQAEYAFVGYPLYGTLFTGTIAALGAGAVAPAASIASLKESVPGIQRRLVIAALVLFLIFALLSGYLIATSNLQLLGSAA
jgi:hypothetical protein